MLHTDYCFVYGLSADNMTRMQRLNESHQCLGLDACHCSRNADLTPPLQKRSQAVACCVGVKRTLTLSAQWFLQKPWNGGLGDSEDTITQATDLLLQQ